MRFGKIDYLNLLPFDVCVKAYPLPSYMKKCIMLKKSYPAKLNQDFLFGRIDAGFISSIAGYQSHYTHKVCPTGIIAKGAVWSVIVKKGSGFDYQSDTSNALLQVLGLQGEVLIGDRALLFKHNGGEFEDMGALWWERTRLPFVFGRLCFRAHGKLIERISRVFNKHYGNKHKKIPYYILMAAARRSGLESWYILEYLEHIFYAIGAKEKRGLERFYREVRLKRIKRPHRF